MVQCSNKPGFAEFLRPLIGQSAWGVRQGHGSFLTMEFGASVPPRGRPRSDADAAPPPHGEFHLWIYCCNWHLFSAGRVCASSESSREEIAAALEQVESWKLADVSADPRAGSSIFSFGKGAHIQTWPYGDDPQEEQWFVYARSEVLAWRADGMFAVTSGDTPANRTQWQAL